MWNPFRRKTGVDSPRPEGRPDRVESLADALQREGRIGELEARLGDFDRDTLSPGERESWWHLYGIAAFQAGRDGEALERFGEAHARFPSSARIRFSLGQQILRAGSVDEGFALFRTCRFPEVPCEYAMAQARYAYLWSRYDDGFTFLRPFFDAYMRVGILDDHFLYVRGLPLFGQWWGRLAAFALLSGDFRELESVAESVARHCRDHDIDRLRKEWAAIRDDRPDRILEDAEKRLGTLEAGPYPTGNARMNVAVLRARGASGIQSAREHLDHVVLSDRDFPWLEDVWTLATAEIARRFGDSALERERAAAFLARQPLLLEPDLALGFHLLRYQEQLKPGVAKT